MESNLVESSPAPDAPFEYCSEGWKYLPFGEITTMAQYGLSLGASDNGTVPMLRMGNLSDGKVDTTNLIYVDLNTEELEKFCLRSGDILFNRTNSPDLVGKTSLFELDDKYVCASYIVRFRVKEAVADPRFVMYFFNAPETKQFLKSISTRGVSQANINPTVLQERLLVPIPPLTEQHRIAKMLSCWDQGINCVSKTIIKNQERLRWMTHKLLFGEVRQDRFRLSKESQPMRSLIVPRDWKVCTISEIADEVSERNTSNLKLTVLSCTKHKGLVPSLEYFGKQIFSSDISKYKRVPRNHFAYATNHIEEGSIGYQGTYEDSLISPIYSVFKSREQIDDQFLFLLLKTETYRQFFSTATSASVDRRGSLRWKDFSRLPIALPSLEEQKFISEVLLTQKRELALNKEIFEQLHKAKQSLLQKLFSRMSQLRKISNLDREVK